MDCGLLDLKARLVVSLLNVSVQLNRRVDNPPEDCQRQSSKNNDAGFGTEPKAISVVHI